MSTIETLADHVRAIDGSLVDIVEMMAMFNELNAKVGSALTQIIEQIEALHKRLDAQNQRFTRDETHLNEVGARALSFEALIGRMQQQIGTLATDVATVQFGGMHLVGTGPMVPGEQLLAKVTPIDAHLESDYDDRHGDDGA